MRAVSCFALSASRPCAQQPLVRPSVHLSSSLASYSRPCSSVHWRYTPRTRLQRIAAGKAKGGKNKPGDEGEAGQASESEPEVIPPTDITLSPDEVTELFDDVEPDEDEQDVDPELKALMSRLAPSDDEQERLDEYLEPYVDSDGEAWEHSDEVSDEEEEEEEGKPGQAFDIDELIQSGASESVPGDSAGP